MPGTLVRYFSLVTLVAKTATSTGDPPVAFTKEGIGLAGGDGSLAEHPSQIRVAVPGRSAALAFAGGLLDAGGELGPRHQVPGGREPGHVRSQLGEQQACGELADPELQQRLVELKYDPGTVDGKYGGGTAKVTTLRFGVLDVPLDDLIQFADGLPGFKTRRSIGWTITRTLSAGMPTRCFR